MRIFSARAEQSHRNMIISGKQITDTMKEDMKERIERASIFVSLGIIVGEATPATENYLAIKKRFGADIGVSVDIIKSDLHDTDSFVRTIREAAARHKAVIVQLPLPIDVDQEKVLAEIPMGADVDVLSRAAVLAAARGESPFVPPVLGAIRKVFEEGRAILAGKKIVVVGRGRLVGAPVSEWLSREGIVHDVITKETLAEEKTHALKNADIIISGAGVPRIITADMVKNGVMLIDAGTTAEGGSVVGDINPACAEKASLFTPVPGGIGPITVAMLYENVLRAHEI